MGDFVEDFNEPFLDFNELYRKYYDLNLHQYNGIIRDIRMEGGDLVYTLKYTPHVPEPPEMEEYDDVESL